jgi:hypothetical protein
MSKNYNKIYFIIKDKDDFLEDNDQYFKSLKNVYNTSVYTYQDKVYYNIQLNFKQLTKEEFYLFIDSFNDHIGNAYIKNAYYKYKKGTDDIKYSYI